MHIIKKEWKTILFIIWLVGITVFLFRINSQLADFNQKNAKIASTLDSVESVVITTDSSVADIAKKVDGIGGNVNYIVRKVRKR